eukprot:10280-Heterococcus_DN1.PRE.3
MSYIAAQSLKTELSMIVTSLYTCCCALFDTQRLTRCSDSKTTSTTCSSAYCSLLQGDATTTTTAAAAAAAAVGNIIYYDLCYGLLRDLATAQWMRYLYSAALARGATDAAANSTSDSVLQWRSIARAVTTRQMCSHKQKALTETRCTNHWCAIVQSFFCVSAASSSVPAQCFAAVSGVDMRWT